VQRGLVLGIYIVSHIAKTTEILQRRTCEIPDAIDQELACGYVDQELI